MGELLLTDEIRERIAAKYATGVPLRFAVEASGIDWETAKKWRKRGKRGEEPYASYHRALIAARARLAEDLIRDVRHAGEAGDVKASMWLLEKRFPGFYDRRDKGKQPPPQHGSILLYPVALPEGADPRQLVLPQGHAFDVVETQGEEVEDDE